MCLHYLRLALGAWLFQRAVLWLLIRFRKRQVATQARDINCDIEADGTYGSVLSGEGVIRAHVVTDVFDAFGLCGQPTRSVGSFRTGDITCRGCLRLYRRAERQAQQARNG